ncbi:VCBS domain-containing protein [Methylobacterium hispanicum]|uniref:VCBS domain-containing protein n=1 Tax=Methylobacterium hispanicum TaxID=270350 RepID=UPI002F32ABCC
MIDAASKDPDGNGAWGKIIKDALIPIHSMVLPDGKVLAFGTDGTGGDFDARFVYSIYDPATDELKVLPNTTGTNIFCSNMAVDPETGNVIIMGGDNHNTGQGAGTWSGRHDVVMFDYKTQTIRNISETDSNFALHQARWYGTTVTLSNGEILIVGGRDERNVGSTYAEIYNSKTGMRQLTGTEVKDFHDGEGTLTGTYYYPHAWQISNGSVIMIEAGGSSNSGHDVYRMDVSGNGAVAKIGKLPFDTRNLTGSIMYEPDKVLVASTTGQVWKADLSQPTIKWELAFAIKDEDGSGNLVARTNGTFVMLPDGKVAMVGGSSSGGLLADSLGDAQLTVLFWDPVTGKTTYSEAQDLARMYHSTALLLPDGTIYSGGSGSPGPQENANAQILTPGYLYKNGVVNADRPEIEAAPRNVDSGSTVRITVDDTSDIGKITFLKTSGTTHARNADARFVELSYKVVDGNTIEVTIPKANVAPPGVWMLFAVDKAGVPSVAKMVGVDMVPLAETGSLGSGPTLAYNIDHEQIDGAFALAVTARFDDLNGGGNQKVFDLGNGTADTISFGQVGEGRDVAFVIKQGGQTYRLVAKDAIVEGETATWRVGVDPDGTMRITKDAAVIATGKGVVPADVERADYLIGKSSIAGDHALIGLVRDLKIANYGNLAELDPSAPSSPCATTGEAVCLCGLLVPDVDDTPGNDAPKVFETYSTLSGDVTELKNATPGENKAELTTSGLIAFADADAETHTVSLTPKGANYLGTLTLGNPTTGVGAKTGSIAWTFKVNDAALDKLEEGQTVVQTYAVTIDDGHGGVAVQTLKVTLRGSADPGFPTDSQVTVVSGLKTTKADDAVVFGDNVRLMNGGDFGGGSNSLEAGNFFELRNGNLDFGNSLHTASVKTGLGARFNGGDILMDGADVRNTVVLGEENTFSQIRMSGSGAGLVDSVTIGDRSKSDSGIVMNGAGTAKAPAEMQMRLGDGVSLGGGIDANGAYSAKTLTLGTGVTVGGGMNLNGNQNVNTVKAGDGFTLKGGLSGSPNGVDTVTLGKNWNIDGRVDLGGGDDKLSLGLSSIDTSTTTFDGGGGTDALALSIDAADLASFEAAARAAGWTALGNDAWSARGNLTWRNMTFTNFERAELTVAGRNDAPEIVGSGTTKTGSVREIADGLAGENNAILKTNGTIAFTDKNVGDTHSVTITPKEAGYLGTMEYKQPTSAQFGLLPWVFSVNSGALDWLAEGQVRTQSYDVAITDSKGARATETITVTITGSNDAPVIAAATSTATGAVAELADGAAGENQVTHKAGGTIAFADADIIDTHRASYSAGGKDYLGTFGLGTAAGGKLAWTFQVDDAALDGLAAGEVRTQSYAVTIDDGHGGTASQTVTVTIRGAYDDPNANQAPIVDVQGSTVAGAVTELTESGAGEPAAVLSSTGSIRFRDPDAAGAVPTVSVAARGEGYVGALKIAAVGADSVGWAFSVVDAAVNGLAAGEQRVQVYDVTIADGRGGRTTQAVTVTLTGTNDAPVIVTKTSVLSGGVTELPDKSPGEDRTTLTTGGAITFTDADRIDTHGASVAPRGEKYLGSFKLGDVAGGQVGWTFSVEDAAINHLGKGAVLTQAYDVAVTDGKGGRAVQTVVVTITGAEDNDAPSHVTFGALQTGPGNDAIVWGDAVTLRNGGNFGAGANSLSAGDGFTLQGGNLDFNASSGPASLSLGKGANLNGGDIYMGANGVANSVSVGDGGKLSYIAMNGGGAGAAQSLTLGEKVTTDYLIAMNGSGTAADAMELALTIGAGSVIGGAIYADGSNALKTVTLGSGVTVNGGLSLQGANNTTAVRIGDGLTLKGSFAGANSGSETVEIGRDWQIDGTVDLGGGNDRLKIGTTARDTSGTINAGAGKDDLEVVLTADQRASFESAASAARWVRTADGSWDTQGRSLSWQGQTYANFESARTTLAAGSSGVPQKTLIETLQASAGDDAFILGSDVTLRNGPGFGGGANSLSAGDGFTLQGGNLDFNASSGPASLSLGKGANLNGGDIYMGANGVANSVSVGDGGKLSYVAMNGGGAGAAQSLTLGEKVTTDYVITMNGSGTAADAMELALTIGAGSVIGGAIYADGSNAAKTVTLGSGVTVNGGLSLQGANNTTAVRIGDGLTLKGGFAGANSGSETVEIGRDWQIDGTVNLGGGNDRLKIGTTTRDTSGTINGGAGTDSLEIVVTGAQKTAFDAAAKAAGWSPLADGGWNTLGKALTWQGVNYTGFETARATVEPAGVLAADPGDGHIGSVASVAAVKSGIVGQPTAAGTLFVGTEKDDFIVGTDGADVMRGGAGDDRFVGGKGDDAIEGGAGRDVAEFAGKASDYTFLKDADGTLHVTSAAEGRDVLHDVEAVFFHGSGETVTVDHLSG